MVHRREDGMWAVVLAAGEGRRLASLTAALYGEEVPKQFAVLEGHQSLLQKTLRRIAPLAPARRTVVVVPAKHADLAREQLRPFPGTRMVVQPANLDTAPGILLPLAHILARDPSARVAIFPSDHYVADPAPFLRSVRDGRRASDHSPESVFLLGVVPDRPETEYGWIVPGAPLEGAGAGEIRSVRRFVEKPEPDLARRIQGEGGLWNTFVSIGRLSAFWSLADRHLPGHAGPFRDFARCIGTTSERGQLQDLYRRLSTANFSRAVLECASELAVIPVADSGWSDWGSPSRVFRSLEGTHHLDRLRARLSPVAPALATA